MMIFTVCPFWLLWGFPQFLWSVIGSEFPFIAVNIFIQPVTCEYKYFMMIVITWQLCLFDSFFKDDDCSLDYLLAQSLVLWFSWSRYGLCALQFKQFFKPHCWGGGVTVVIYWFHRCHFGALHFHLMFRPHKWGCVRGYGWVPSYLRLIGSGIPGHRGFIGDLCSWLLPHWLCCLVRWKLLRPSWSHSHVFQM